jgi:hypothetical protein
VADAGSHLIRYVEISHRQLHLDLHRLKPAGERRCRRGSIAHLLGQGRGEQSLQAHGHVRAPNGWHLVALDTPHESGCGRSRVVVLEGAAACE